MKSMMYLCLARAKPTKASSLYTQGKNYPLLVFALSPSVKTATALAVEHLESTGWMEVEVDKVDPVDVNAIKNAQPEVVSAYEIALKDGSHGMALDNNIR